MKVEVKNAGNAHFQMRGLHVAAKGKGSQFEKTVPGWYVLAGGERDFDLDLSHEECLHAREFAVKVDSDQAKGQALIAVGPGDCTP